MNRICLIFCLLIATIQFSFAQYPFENKKAEKLYYKLEEYYANYDYDKILKAEPEITDFFLSKEDTLAALMYSFLGEAFLYATEDLNTASEMMQKEYALRKSLGSDNIGDVIYNLAHILDEIGEYQETEKMYLDLLSYDREHSGERSEAYIYSNFAFIDHYMRTEEANKGLRLAQKLKPNIEKSSFEEALYFKYIGDLYTISGELSKAESSLIKSINTIQALDMSASLEYVSILNSLGALYNDRGALVDAERVYLTAMNSLNKLSVTPHFSEYQSILNNSIAVNYTDLGNYELAEEIYLENLKIDEELYGADSYFYAIDAGNLADNYKYAQKWPEALEYYDRAGEIYKSTAGENSPEVARILQSKAFVKIQTGEIEEAISLATKATKILESSTENKLYLGTAEYNLAEAYLANGQTKEGQEHHQQALSLRQKALGKQHLDYAKSTLRLANVSWSEKDAKKAQDYFDQTFSIYFHQIENVFPILSEEEKTKFYYNLFKPSFEQFNSFAIQNAQEMPELLGKMYDYQLQTKGLIVSATGKVRSSILNSGDSSLIKKYETWIGQKEMLAKLFSANELSIETRNRKIDSLTNASDNLEKELSILSADFGNVFTNQKLTWKDVQKTLKPKEAAVEIIRLKDYQPQGIGSFTNQIYYAALILTNDSNGPKLVLLENGDKMESRYLSNYRNAIKYQVNENYSYRLFWEPIAQNLKGIETVYFSPDGVYNQISIYTLRNPATNNFTIDELKIHLVTNTSDLIASAKVNESSDGNYLYGYPNYNMGILEQRDEAEIQKTVEDAAKAASENRGRGLDRDIRGAQGPLDRNQARSLPRGLRGNMMRYMSGNHLLSLLPGTKKEVLLIDSLFSQSSNEAILLLSNEALEDSIKSIKSPKTLHIATHGFFMELDEEELTDTYSENPLLRSGLILAGANSFIVHGSISETNNFDEDGILTAYEAMNLNLNNTELVVLSACETGLGEIKNGEGVYGLQRAFRIAGAKSMIMSMWTVDDDATQELMTTFYESWLGGMSKQEAFIKAQQAIKEKWSAPYYWGAFVMIGE